MSGDKADKEIQSPLSDVVNVKIMKTVPGLQKINDIHILYMIASNMQL